MADHLSQKRVFVFACADLSEKGESFSCSKLSKGPQVSTMAFPMDDIIEAIATNNSGILYLMSKNYKEAMMSFLYSARKTKELLLTRLRKNGGRGGLLHSQVPFPPDQRRHSSQFTMELVDFGTTELGAAELSDEEDHISSLVCRNAIFVRQIAPQTPIVDDLTSITVSALYNLAITNHLAGIDHRCTSKLEMAVQCYELVLSMQKVGTTAGLSTPHVMSALNNVAMIHRVLNNENKLRRNLQQLFVIMAHIDTRDGERNERYWMQYLRNITSLFLHPSITAKAA
ncbi:unnamed protein product [Cylindrotheca closterium]|uniref:Uncharacterized protein n=1 Tax=Cylindrotheca closterium TaxID=2856 RepID=A0AAD2G2G4_9STRA|nr:unnamed protein product [Cylindrotheca closterium]